MCLMPNTLLNVGTHLQQLCLTPWSSAYAQTQAADELTQWDRGPSVELDFKQISLTWNLNLGITCLPPPKQTLHGLIDPCVVLFSTLMGGGSTACTFQSRPSRAGQVHCMMASWGRWWTATVSSSISKDFSRLRAHWARNWTKCANLRNEEFQ